MFTLLIEVKEMGKRKLKKSVIPMLYALAIVAVLGCAYMIENVISNQKFENDDHYGYVNKTIFDETVPVVGEQATKMIRPYTDTNVKIVKNYYDYKADSEKQQNSLIYHDNTYIQNSGVSYGGIDNFDVVAVLDGTVVSVKEDKLLGNVVEIKHANDIISVYQSLGKVNVKNNDTVKQGTVIGTCGTSNISKELNNHLNFELIKGGQIVNPEEYYDKVPSEG